MLRFIFIVGIFAILGCQGVNRLNSELFGLGSVPSTALHSATVSVNALFPPLTPPPKGCPNGVGGSPGYCDFFTYVALQISGANFYLPWNVVDTGSAPCVEGPSTTCNWSAFETQILPFINAGLKVNFIVEPISDVLSNTVTPAYVFTPTYASGLSSPPQDISNCAQYPGDANTPVQGSTNSGVWNYNSCSAATGIMHRFCSVYRYYRDSSGL